MEKGYKNIILLFIVILLIVIIGFYKSYFGLFPNFVSVDNTMHFHAIVIMAWFLLLLIQPILIKKNKIEIHRKIGYFSYVLVPIIVVSMVAITKHMYIRESTTTTMMEKERLADLFLPLSQMVVFTVLYILAMINQKKTPLHLRYIITCSLVLLAPGLERIPIYWFEQPEQQSTIFAFIITDLTILFLLFYDRKNNKNYNAYPISLVLLLLVHILYQLIPTTDIWQAIGRKIVTNLF